MEKITVPFITGDGVGAEVTPSMQAVVNAAVKKSYGDRRGIEWKEVLAGERAFHETGSWLPDETMEASAPIRWTSKSLTLRRWRYPFLERSLASDARFVCLPTSGTLV